MVNVSAHAKERYARRIMNKDDENEIKRYAIENSDKIISDINKMIEYGKEIYNGRKVDKNNKDTIISVYVKDTWVILVDNPRNNVITLYKVNLIDDEDDDEKFNQTYVDMMLKKLKSAKDMLDIKSSQIRKENGDFADVIKENEDLINNYKSYIKKLEALNDGYREAINNSNVIIAIAEKKVINIVNRLIGKKEF